MQDSLGWTLLHRHLNTLYSTRPSGDIFSANMTHWKTTSEEIDYDLPNQIFYRVFGWRVGANPDGFHPFFGCLDGGWEGWSGPRYGIFPLNAGSPHPPKIGEHSEPPFSLWEHRRSWQSQLRAGEKTRANHGWSKTATTAHGSKATATLSLRLPPRPAAELARIVHDER
jgi:hypothetical protein